MSKLLELQKSFQDFVLSGSEDFKRRVKGKDDPFITTRTDIYQSAYRLRLTGVLKIDFPGLHTIAGDEQFAMICRDYIKHYPSDHFSVRYFGRFMSEFLTNTSPYSEHRLLADMAGFEWAVSEVLDAEDRHVFSIEELQDISPALWPEMTIILHPSLIIIPLEWNVPKFWQLVKEDKEPKRPTEYPQIVKWVLWRKELEVYFRSLEEDEAWALTATAQGNTFAELCEGLCEWVEPENVVARVTGFLQNWIAEETITCMHMHGQI